MQGIYEPYGITDTNLLKNDINMKVIQEYHGHSTITITAKFYLHPDIEDKKIAVNALSNVLQLQAPNELS